MLFAEASRAGTYVDTVSVYEGVNLVLPTGDPLHAGNHSCDPTMWWTDPYTLVARRDVQPGQELTLDYATISSVCPRVPRSAPPPPGCGRR